MNSSVLNERPQKALQTFLHRCAEMNEDIDIKLVADTARVTIKYLRGDKSLRNEMQLGQALEIQWYKSLAKNTPDWSVYNTDYYLAELWACWAVYSRVYLRGILKTSSLPPRGIAASFGSVAGIVDLGCGFGYTTAALKQMFSSANVTGTNLPNILQTRIAQKVGSQHNFQIVSDVSKVNHPVNTVFAFEYFEHIPEPIAHLYEIVNTLKPRAFLIANSFSTRAIGHFDYYTISRRRIKARAISKIFNSELRRLGYAKVKTKLWNNRPAYWVKRT